MADARTTSVDRRMIEHIIQAVPGNLSEGAIKSHLGHKALSHRFIRELLAVDPTAIDGVMFSRAIRGEKAGSVEISRFAPGVLDRVRALGGQFENTQVTTVPGGETLDSQKDRVIKFWTDWHWKDEERARLTVEPSIASQVIYLEDLVEGSLNCTYDKVDERKTVEEILASLPRVEGLRWTLGNAPTVNRVLADHLKETGKHLLPYIYTWTTDEYQSEKYGLRRLFVGFFRSRGVGVSFLRSGRSIDYVGVFALGVPE